MYKCCAMAYFSLISNNFNLRPINCISLLDVAIRITATVVTYLTKTVSPEIFFFLKRAGRFLLPWVTSVIPSFAKISYLPISLFEFPSLVINPIWIAYFCLYPAHNLTELCLLILFIVIVTIIHRRLVFFREFQVD